MSSGLQHIHLRKRMTGKNMCEPYPARSPFKRGLDRLMLFIAILAPLALLPQVLRVYHDGNVSGLSIYTWVALTAVNGLWALYGVVHRDKLVFLGNFLITILNLSIAIGIFIYR